MTHNQQLKPVAYAPPDKFPSAKTGLGFKNQIRLISKVTKVHQTNSNKVPNEIRVPLDSFMHYSLGQIEEHYKDRTVPAIFVLKGNKYEPVFAGFNTLSMS